MRERSRLDWREKDDEGAKKEEGRRWKEKGFRRAASKTIFNAHGIENAHMPCTCRQGRVKLTLFAK